MSKIRECKECGIDFETEHGRKVYCSIPCKTKYQNRKYGGKRRAELRDYLQSIKLKLGCAMCGYNKHPAALHFDHLDPNTKEYSLGNNTIPLNKLEEEIAKCQVLCANCHAEKTWENKYE